MLIYNSLTINIGRYLTLINIYIFFLRNPTPLGRDNSILSINWEPVNSINSTESIPYLDITQKLECKMNPEKNRLSFWDEIYRKYNGNM